MVNFVLLVLLLNNHVVLSRASVDRLSSLMILIDTSVLMLGAKAVVGVNQALGKMVMLILLLVLSSIL